MERQAGPAGTSRSPALRLVAGPAPAGTARLLDPAAGRTCRLPLEGGHLLPGDAAWQPLYDLAVATPCGLVHRGDWGWATTRVLAVLAGLVPDWLHHPSGPAVFDLVLARADHVAPAPGAVEHPADPCGALYCALRPR